MRFVPRFSRARVRTASVPARLHVQDVGPGGVPPSPKTLFFLEKTRFWLSQPIWGMAVRSEVRDAPGEKRGFCRTWMPQMLHLDCRVPKTFTFLAARVVYPHRTRAPLMYSAATPGVDSGVFFLKFQTGKTGHFVDPNTLQGLFS